jgi:hypothetical protein
VPRSPPAPHRRGRRPNRSQLARTGVTIAILMQFSVVTRYQISWPEPLAFLLQVTLARTASSRVLDKTDKASSRRYAGRKRVAGDPRLVLLRYFSGMQSPSRSCTDASVSGVTMSMDLTEKVQMAV